MDFPSREKQNFGTQEKFLSSTLSLLLNLKVETMDTIVSSSTPLFGSSLPPAGAVTTATVSNKLCSTHITGMKHLFLRSPTSQRKQQLSRSLKYSTVPKFRVKCGSIKEINESEFSSTVLKSDNPVLVEFVANWCGPCRLISPAMESVAQEYGDRLTVVKIDHDANPRLIEEYKVYGLPTLIFFKNGQEVPESRREGAITKVKLKEYVDALLQIISVA